MRSSRYGPTFFIATCLMAVLLALAPRPAAAQKPGAGLFDRPVLVFDSGMHVAPIRRGDVNVAADLAATGSQDRTVRLWKLSTGEPLRTIRMPTGPGDIGKVYAVALSPDGTTVAVGGWTRWRRDDPQDQIYFFDVRTGAMTGRLDGLRNVVLHLKYSQDGNRLAATLGGGAGMRLYEKTASGRWVELARDESYGDRSYGAVFADDGRIATTSYDGTVRLYDPQGNFLRSAKTPDPTPYGIAFNPRDGRLAVGHSGSPMVQIYDGTTLEPLGRPDLDGITTGDLVSVAWSADGRTLFAAGQYDDGTSNPVLAWPEGGHGPRSVHKAGQTTVMSLTSLADGGVFIAAGDPWLGRMAADGTLVWHQEPSQMDGRAQRHNFAVSDDGMVVDFGFEVWGRNRARFDVAALTLIPGNANDEITKAPRQDGLPVENWMDKVDPTFNGEPMSLQSYERARSLAIDSTAERFLLGTEWSLRAFDKDGTQLWRKPVPGVAWAVNISGDGQLAVAAYGDGTIRWHRMSDGGELLALFPYPDGVNWVVWEPDGRYASSLRARRALKWFVNRSWDEAPLELRAGQIPHSFRPEVVRRVLPQMGTPNAVYAAEEAERAEAFRRLTGGIAPGARLHVLAVGVSDYVNAAERLNLDWADDDAADIARALIGQTDWPYQRGFQSVLRRDEARGLTILDQLDRMRDRIKLSPDGRDLAVIMFSGHGVVRGEGETEEFYLLPYDADVASESRIRRTGISGSELQRQIAAMATYSRVLVLLDTCSSGAALNDGGLGVEGRLLRRRLGGMNVTVLASSAGTEVSRESPEWQNGAFTEVVLEALGKAGDGDGNGMISVDELASYVSRRLPVLSGQYPSIERRFGGDLFVSGL